MPELINAGLVWVFLALLIAAAWAAAKNVGRKPGGPSETALFTYYRVAPRRRPKPPTEMVWDHFHDDYE